MWFTLLADCFESFLTQKNEYLLLLIAAVLLVGSSLLYCLLRVRAKQRLSAPSTKLILAAAVVAGLATLVLLSLALHAASDKIVGKGCSSYRAADNRALHLKDAAKLSFAFWLTAIILLPITRLWNHAYAKYPGIRRVIRTVRNNRQSQLLALLALVAIISIGIMLLSYITAS